MTIKPKENQANPPQVEPEPETKRAVLQVGKESAASANVYVISPLPALGNYQITVRSHCTAEDIDSLLTNIGRLETGLLERGWTFKQVGDSPKKSAGAAPPPKGTPPKAAPPPKGEQKGQGHENADENDSTFPALELSAEIKGGKVYWQITSARAYPKFATRVWPEVLEAAGFNVDELDETVRENPQQVFDLDGYTAHFVRNDSGNPSKVVKLE